MLAPLYWLQLQYRVEKNIRILVIVHIFWQNGEKTVMKCAMYVFDQEDIDFLRAYLAGLVLTLGIQCVILVQKITQTKCWVSTVLIVFCDNFVVVGEILF